MFGRVQQAVERASISALRKASRACERGDEFLCWTFGLTSLEEALVMKEVNDVSMGLARWRDRGDFDNAEYVAQLDRGETAIRLRRALSRTGSDEPEGAA